MSLVVALSIINVVTIFPPLARLDDLPALRWIANVWSVFGRASPVSAVVAEVDLDRVAEWMIIGALHIVVRVEHVGER